MPFFAAKSSVMAASSSPAAARPMFWRKLHVSGSGGDPGVVDGEPGVVGEDAVLLHRLGDVLGVADEVEDLVAATNRIRRSWESP